MKLAIAYPDEKRTALKTELFADEQHRKKTDALGDPLVEIACLEFSSVCAGNPGRKAKEG
ncbi:hypothetical protein [Thiorhodospira sibirica]|uniref:hypothetical protein n=1 Tax=Thiorhodospira sibirica TaxID=154347 RepID=UPI00031A69E7|nr:hypothetical protein [Thiorhodospira sibirica]